VSGVYLTPRPFPTRRSSDLEAARFPDAEPEVCFGTTGHEPVPFVKAPKQASGSASGQARSRQLLAAGDQVPGGLPPSSDCCASPDRKSTRLNSSHVNNSYAV